MHNIFFNIFLVFLTAQRVSLYISDDNLKTFYHEFMVSEAGHYRTFLDLARLYAPEVKVLRRWKEMVDFEAEIMQKRELRGDRMH